MEPHYAVILIVLFGIWLLAGLRSARPEFPPLPTSPDDPLMQEALEKARDSIEEFRRRLQEPRQHALVKVAFKSSSEAIEHHWAEVLEVVSHDELKVRLVTPPVSHSGRLERVQHFNFQDVEDWQVFDAKGHIFGGFSQRAMFAIARRDGVRLSKKLLEQEKLYF